MLEPIDGKQTKWEGLWWHPDFHNYSSACLKLSDLRKFKGKVRLYVRKNRYYNGGENGRPNYHFCIKAVESDQFHEIELEDAEQDGVIFTKKELQHIIDLVACEVGGEGEFGEHIVEDYTDKFR